MATTVQDATLKSIITDSVTLKGTTYGGVTTSSLANSDEVYQRIMTVPAYDVGRQDFVSLIGATDAPNSGGDVDVQKFSYARFTNLDSNYPLYLKITNQNGVCDSSTETSAYAIILNPGASFLLQDSVFLAAQGAIVGADISDATNYNRYFTVFALADIGATQGIDVEIFVVTK